MRIVIIIAAMAVSTLAGCSRESFPETYPVTGVVTYQGKPVDGATVNLVPMSANGRSAAGITDPEGKFSVTSYFSPEHSPSGALPGDYAVTISKLLVLEIPKGMTAWEEQAWSTKNPAKFLLPKSYINPETSGFKATVGNGPPEPLKLDLHD